MPKKQTVGSKSKGLFDDLDALLAECDSLIKEIDTPASSTAMPPRSTIFSDAATRPDVPTVDSEHGLIWQRPTEIQWPTGETVSITEFLSLLERYANRFVWNDFLDGKPIRGWSKDGNTFDPVTAVAIAMIGKHYIIALSDMAAADIGLSEDDGKAAAWVSCNFHPQILEKNPDKLQLRQRIIAAIKRGIEHGYSETTKVQGDKI